MRKPLRHHKEVVEHQPFGDDKFGALAERVARFSGTAQYIVGQTLIVICWVGLNVVAAKQRWDPYPFILLNLAFSTQAAYAAPLILLAQTRQADRDKLVMEADAKHREEIASVHTAMLQTNIELTEQIARLTKEVHEHINKPE